MSTELTFHRCPETGICSIFHPDESKIDLMPFEVDAIRDAKGNQDAIKAVISDCDTAFAAKLTAADLERIGQRVK